MSMKDIITTMKDTCRALEEKKLRLEALIAGLELEEDDEEAEEDDGLNDEEPKDTEGSKDI
jgi:hypothetical protein